MAIKGSITVDEILIIEVDQSPQIDPIPAPIGSIAIHTDGSDSFQKTGSNDSDWVSVGNTISIINAIIFG